MLFRSFSYQLFIALRYFKAKKRHRGLSISTLISIAGVALGVMALVVVLSMMGGFHEDLQKKILGIKGHIIVRNYDGRISDYKSVIEKINSIPGVKHSAPAVYGQVMLGFGNRAHGVILRGVEPDLEAGITDISKFFKEGSIDNLKRDDSETPGIIVGQGLRGTLGLFFLGEQVKMISPMGDIGPLGMLPKMKKFKIVGVFEMGMYEADSNLALVNIRDAQDFFKLGNDITGIEIKVDEAYAAGEIAEKIEAELGPPYYAIDWMDMNKNLFYALQLEKWAIFISLTLIVIVASFNIISNLIMIVTEKAREIAIMKAMGATGRSIMSIFMIQGLIIGIVGTVLGLLGGTAVCLLLKIYKIPLPPSVYYLSYLPFRIYLLDFIIVSIAAIVISFLATIYPSWRASKLDPVDPLRHE